MSGIKGTPVARLSQTWELIPSLTLRKFLSLDRLMGSRPSHSTYRLAWGNSTTARIPFLPMHRGDLVSAEEGNRTFVDKEKTRINWKKFEVMGEIVVTLQLSQQSPYGELHQLDDVERLILEMKLPTDDEVSSLTGGDG